MTREQREKIRIEAYKAFLAENSELQDSTTLQYVFEQGFLAGQLHEIDNSTKAFQRIAEGVK